jgi:hypothetical protein
VNLKLNNVLGGVIIGAPDTKNLRNSLDHLHFEEKGKSCSEIIKQLKLQRQEMIEEMTHAIQEKKRMEQEFLIMRKKYDKVKEQAGLYKVQEKSHKENEDQIITLKSRADSLIIENTGMKEEL